MLLSYPFRLKQIVGVADAKVSANTEEILVTYWLRTSVAVVAADMEAKIFGMLHFQLPCHHDDKTSKVKNASTYWIKRDKQLSTMKKQF